MPWHSHFSGKSAAICCIQDGSSVVLEEHPGGELQHEHDRDTRADAPRPLRGTEENATPSSVQQSRPSTLTQVNVHQSAGLAGQVHVEQRHSDRHHHDDLDDVDDQHQADLADEVRGLRHRCALQPLQRPVVPLLRDADREVLERRVDDAGGQHPGQEVLAERDAGCHVPGERRPEHHQQQHRQQHGEERRLAVAGELEQLDAHPPHADRPGAGQPAGRAGRARRAGRVGRLGHPCSPTISR
jgi:hypothetical protein